MASASTESSTQVLSTKDRLQNFEKAWKAIHDNYYDPDMNGVNWDEIHQRYRPLVEAVTTDKEYFQLLQRMTGELHDPHTVVLAPEEVEYFKKHQRVRLSIGAQEFEGKLVVTRVDPGSDAEQAGVQTGMTVQTIDGEPLAGILAQDPSKLPDSSPVLAARRRLAGIPGAGPPGSTVRYGLQRQDGSSFEVTLARKVDALNAGATAKLLPSGNAYVSLMGFYPPVTKAFKDALLTFHDAPGLIIDLRGNPGGQENELLSMANHFFSTKTAFGKIKMRTRDPRPLYVGDKGGSIYSGPVVILVNERSASASEVFTSGMQETGRAKVVGERSCGCVLGVFNPVELKGGGMLNISRILFFSPSGRKLEGSGVTPDKAAEQTLPDVMRKRDTVLDAGEEILKEMSTAARK
ncbi:MAG TPA: S41 family peptidase [Alphaproteobacteria bacterium]|nr:S41 family peptidase [Alphaproteobacteria bacterium]